MQHHKTLYICQTTNQTSVNIIPLVNLLHQYDESNIEVVSIWNKAVLHQKRRFLQFCKDRRFIINESLISKLQINDITDASSIDECKDTITHHAAAFDKVIINIGGGRKLDTLILMQLYYALQKLCDVSIVYPLLSKAEGDLSKLLVWDADPLTPPQEEDLLIPFAKLSLREIMYCYGILCQDDPFAEGLYNDLANLYPKNIFRKLIRKYYDKDQPYIKSIDQMVRHKAHQNGVAKDEYKNMNWSTILSWLRTDKAFYEKQVLDFNPLLNSHQRYINHHPDSAYQSDDPIFRESFIDELILQYPDAEHLKSAKVKFSQKFTYLPAEKVLYYLLNHGKRELKASEEMLKDIPEKQKRNFKKNRRFRASTYFELITQQLIMGYLEDLSESNIIEAIPNIHLYDDYKEITEIDLLLLSNSGKILAIDAKEYSFANKDYQSRLQVQRRSFGEFFKLIAFVYAPLCDLPLNLIIDDDPLLNNLYRYRNNQISYFIYDPENKGEKSYFIYRAPIKQEIGTDKPKYKYIINPEEDMNWGKAHQVLTQHDLYKYISSI